MRALSVGDGQILFAGAVADGVPVGQPGTVAVGQALGCGEHFGERLQWLERVRHRLFRAEPHDTARHLAEYTSLDVELGFITDHHDVMDVLAAALTGMMTAVQQRAADAVARLEISLPAVPDRIPEIDFGQAQELIAANTDTDPRGEPDLAPADERWLSEWALSEHGSAFLFVTGYPTVKRPFYTHPDPEQPERTRSFDLLFKGLELVTGGQRLHRHDHYLTALTTRGEDPDDYASYLDVFAHGMPPQNAAVANCHLGWPGRRRPDL